MVCIRTATKSTTHLNIPSLRRLCDTIHSRSRPIGIYLDIDVSMRCHVSRTVSHRFGILRQLRTIRRSVSQSFFQSLVAALVLTKLDFGNATLAPFRRFNWTAYRRQWMQRLDLSSREVSMIISLRYSAVCTGFVCRSAYLSSLPPWYTSAFVDFHRPTFSRSPGFSVDNACGHRRRRHSTFRLRDCPLSATERFPSPRHEHGTVWRKWRH